MEASRGLPSFFALCDAFHREFYSSVLSDWGDLGLPWEAKEGRLWLQCRSRGEKPVVFQLTAGSAPQIRASRLNWPSFLGDDAFASFEKEILEIPFLVWRKIEDELSIDCPGHLWAPGQRALRRALMNIGVLCQCSRA